MTSYRADPVHVAESGDAEARSGGMPVARRTDWWRMSSIVIIWATSLIVVALWVSGGAVEDLLRWNADTLNTLGRISGLVSANLLLYQVLLLAQVPLFERGFGRDGIARMHRLVGFWSFWLMLAHILLLTVGYAIQSNVNVFVQAWQFVWDYPGMLLGTAGTGLLVLVVITSLRRARRRLRYESWHLLHLYAYAGVGLAIPHMLWTGADFLSSPLATAYWWGLWIVAAACVLFFRLLRPLILSVRHGVRVVSVEQDGARGVLVRMSGKNLSRLAAQSGQFFVWRFLDGAGWSRGHPFSLSSAPSDHSFTISARVLGDGTHRLTTLKPGTRVLFEGPFGRMTGQARQGRKLLMLGAGAGVAPLVSLLESETYARGDAVLIVRDSVAAHGLRSAAIAALAHDRGVRVAWLPGPRAPGGSAWLPQSHASWRGRDALEYVMPDPDEFDAFVCGPEPWMHSVLKDLKAAGMRPNRIHTERFSI
jgi:predicted ferric reductase